MPSPLFKAKFRVVENTKAEKENDPTHKMPMEFTPEDARAAAQYLIDMANKAEDEGTTIRKYSGQNDNVFHFKTGFSKLHYPFSIWKWIVDPERYGELCKARGGGANHDHFPCYRSSEDLV